MNEYILAIDIGASSGRHMVGHYEGESLVLKEEYRFSNGVKNLNNHLVWDIDYLFQEVKKGIKIVLDKYEHISSLSIDTWGVDYVLLDENDQIIKPCYSYRDNRTLDIIDEVHSLIPFNELYTITGSQFQPFNTIYQLYKDKKEKRLMKAKDYLMIPEYLIYKLTGIKKYEYTNRGTTALLDLNKKIISLDIINKLNLPSFINQPLSKPSSIVGYLTKDIVDEIGHNILVKLCATHDTASAVCGIDFPLNTLYISSGTWSLLGIKTINPIISEESLRNNYSNELGPDYIRFQKNIMGLWIVQNLAKELKIDFVTMVELAKESSFTTIYDVNDKMFLNPSNMVDTIKEYYKLHKLTQPNNINDILNCTYHSLAYSYSKAIKEIESITKTTYDKIFIFGGGAKNNYLNELTKEYTKKEVIILPVEATSIGNIKSQDWRYNNAERSN